MFAALSMALLWSGVAYLSYLALEPYVRRTLPSMLVTWARLLSGRVGDPMVGRDLLVGTVAGLAIVTFASLLYLIPRQLGWPDALPARPWLEPLAGYRETFAFLARAPFEATLEVMQGIFVLALVRHGLTRFGQRVGRPWIGSSWIAGALVSALYLVIVMRTAVDATYPALQAAQTLVIGVGILVLVIRLGLFAGIVAFLVSSLASSLPWTLDPSKIYAGPVFVTMGLIAGLGAVGFWRARAGNER